MNLSLWDSSVPFLKKENKMTREENNILKDWIKGVAYSVIIPVIITVVTKNILIAIAYLAVLTFIYVFLIENKPSKEIFITIVSAEVLFVIAAALLIVT